MSLLRRGSHWKRPKPRMNVRASIMRTARKRVAGIKIANAIKKNMFKVKRAFKIRKMLYSRSPFYSKYRR